MRRSVSTLVVEWIEIWPWSLTNQKRLWVSTLVVEWIEIDLNKLVEAGYMVSTLVVEWIEIYPADIPR